MENRNAKNHDATACRRRFLCGIAAMAATASSIVSQTPRHRRAMADSLVSDVAFGAASAADPAFDPWPATFPAFPDEPPDAPVVVLRDGSRLAASVSLGVATADPEDADTDTDITSAAPPAADIAEPALSLSGWSHRSRIPWNRVAAIVRTVPGDPDRRSRLWDAVLAESRQTPTDSLFLIGGDRVTGDRLTYDPGSPEDPTATDGFFSIRVAEGNSPILRIPADRVAVATWGTRSAEPPAFRPVDEFPAPPESPRDTGRLGLRDGSFFAVRPWNISTNPVEAVPVEAAAVEMPSLVGGGFAHIADGEISYREPPVPHRTWLSDQSPERYEENPLFGLRRGWGRDRTPEGAGLRVPNSSRLVRRGVSQPVGSRLVFTIPAGFHGSFRAGFAAMTSLPEPPDPHSSSAFSPHVPLSSHPASPARSIRGRLRFDGRIVWEIPSHSPSDGMIPIDFPIRLPPDVAVGLELLADPPVPGVPLADGSLCAIWYAASLWPAPHELSSGS